MERIPAWVGQDGYPRSWAHYVYGMAYLTRARVRRLLDMAESTRAAGSVERGYREWVDERREAQRRT